MDLLTYLRLALVIFGSAAVIIFDVIALFSVSIHCGTSLNNVGL